jgi:predicted O-methyltransferase YrrM
MSFSKSLLNPRACFSLVLRGVRERWLRLHPNFRGAVMFPPGHFHSPLLDIKGFGLNEAHLPFDGPEWWEHVNMRAVEQRSYYQDLLQRFPVLPFPRQKTDRYRYFTENNWFPLSDAFTLSGIIRKERPHRIVEIGAGFSSAVMLDTLDHTNTSSLLTFIEPYPQRLHGLLSANDKAFSTIVVQRVQEVSLSVFDQLEAQDLLFIDSSHVSKVGSDVTFILLRILPRLKSGVFVHFHDIFYPYAYPHRWIRDGFAWNESLFLRAFLINNLQFELIAFNSYAGFCFAEFFRDQFPLFLNDTGASIWIKKVSAT